MPELNSTGASSKLVLRVCMIRFMKQIFGLLFPIFTGINDAALKVGFQNAL